LNQTYVDTVRLLLFVAPRVFASGRLGLKGGTGLNAFIHDMPRLSIDIDAAYLDHAAPWEVAIAALGDELVRTKTELETQRLTVAIPANQEGEEVRLVVSDRAAQVKIEVNKVFRATLHPVAPRSLVAAAEDLFTTSVTLPALAAAELYGSKLVAAFDRHHPRDWFDILHLRHRDGLTSDVVGCFVAYLAGHSRPVHEILFPSVKPMQAIYEAGFAGMTRDDVGLVDLEGTRTTTLAELPRLLFGNQREFLLSLVRAEPRLESMPFKHLRELAAVRWKLQNLEALRLKNRRKFLNQHDDLAQRFAAID